MPDSAVPPVADAHIETVRELNRVLTSRFGLLRDVPYGHGLTLPQARIIFELAHGERTLSALRDTLDLDLGYVSRLVSRLVARKLIRRRTVATDKRARQLSLTAAGRRAFTAVDAASRDQVREVLTTLNAPARERLAEAGEQVAAVLRGEAMHAPTVTIRSHRPGDLGWIVSVHGERYAEDYGWDGTFEGLVADIVARFAAQHDADREHCWIAECDGQRVGSIMLVRHPEHEGVAKLRLLIVDPSARGLGVGKRLVHTCHAFAKAAGYDRIALWTNSILTAARALYVADGYQLVHAEPHHSFGVDLVGETWERPL